MYRLDKPRGRMLILMQTVNGPKRWYLRHSVTREDHRETAHGVSLTGRVPSTLLRRRIPFRLISWTTSMKETVSQHLCFFQGKCLATTMVWVLRISTRLPALLSPAARAVCACIGMEL